MAAKPYKLVKLKSSASAYFYTTKKPNKAEYKLKLMKFDPIVRQHVEFTEEKIK